MSIFLKDCPQCAAENTAQAQRCRCGYFFNPEAIQDRGTAMQLAQHERRSYHDYLAARVVQAEALLQAARADAQTDPDNIYKAAQALAAQQALNTARAEWRAQTLLNLPPGGDQPALPAISQPATAVQASPPPVVCPAPPVVAPAKPTAPAAEPPASAAAAIPIPEPQASPARPTPQTKFRAQQSARAEAIVRRIAERKEIATPAAVNDAAPIAAHECPNCTTSLPINTSRCGCGYRFGNASLEIPALPLDEDARSILIGGDRLALDRG